MHDYFNIIEIKRKIGGKEDIFSSPMFVKILATSFGILNKFPDLNSVLSNLKDDSVYGVSEQIAYINVKKSIGGSEAFDDELKMAYREHRDLLLEQIKIANPNIIIFGNVLDLFENDLQEIGCDLTQAKKFTTDLYPKFPIFYQCDQYKVIVDAYHPACRGYYGSYEYYYTSIIEGLKSIF